VLDVKPRPESGPARSGPQAGLSIAEAARRTGVSVHTLRYYERAGLVVTAIDRTAGGRRRYQQQDLQWITMCARLRSTGMPIKTIRRYAQLVSAGRGNEQERLAPSTEAGSLSCAKALGSSTTRSTSTEAGSPPATPTTYGRPTAQRALPEQFPLRTCCARRIRVGTFCRTRITHEIKERMCPEQR
jgi:DNA-binding transcriptional MerR regulator